jgi:tetratricopeptide (TPR) repeat protein
VSCIEIRLMDDNDNQRCSDVKADARRVLAIDPTSHLAYLLLAASTFALGEPLDTTVEALHQGDAQIVDPTERRSTELYTDEHIFLVHGDLPGAQKALGDIVGLAATKRSIDPFEPLLRQINLALEAGDVAGAKALVKRARALVGALPTSEHDIGTEARLALASVHAGVTTRDELHAEQERLHGYQREIDGRNAGRVDPAIVWSAIYAAGAEDESDGREAMAALEKLGGVELKPLLADHSRDLGSAYALGGRYAEAVPLLEQFVGGCWELVKVLQFQRSRYLLGLSREKTGDIAGAKQAYDSVIARWPNAKPRSVTVEKARAGLARLAKGSAAR